MSRCCVNFTRGAVFGGAQPVGLTGERVCRIATRVATGIGAFDGSVVTLPNGLGWASIEEDWRGHVTI